MATKANVLDAVSLAPGSTERPRRSTINVVLFSGGSGTQNISTALLSHPQISLTVVINAYDDGHSTGRLRRFVPGMLGPSDVRKNLDRLMPCSERSQRSLKRVSNYRLPVGIPRSEALTLLGCLVDGEYVQLPEELVGALPHLSYWQMRRMTSFLRTFLAYFHKQEEDGRTFDFTDCALGNLLFAGCFLEQSRDFNQTVEAFNEFYEVSRHALLNVTQGENLFLVAAKENGTFLLKEEDIVAAQDASKISELFLVDEATYLEKIEGAKMPPPGGWRELLAVAHRVPRICPAAATALAEADVIIYGPGTQHSSLFPSYMTQGVGETIAANSAADKVFIGNIHRDFDIQEEDAGDLAHKLLDAMSRKSSTSVKWTDIVSHCFVQGTDENSLSTGKYVPFDKSRFTFPLETVKVRDWEVQEGRHLGGYVLDEVWQIVQSRIDVELSRLHHMVSIVIPVLNEETTIEAVLKSVTALDFQAMGLTKEVILVDGGSTDQTLERARAIRNVKIFSTSRALGRGAAMRLGIEKARGNLIAFFPGDDEYRAEDLQMVVSSLVQSNFRVVFGTRAVKCTDLSDRLKRIYGNNRRLYLTSKYGGILLSVITLLLYNRYVTDVLSSVKGFDAQFLRSLDLKSDGLDLETEAVAKLSRRREYVLELPVEYKPRAHTAGKKIRAMDGLRALLALFRFRAKD